MTAPPLLLVHGGLWDRMDADGFWRRPGIVAGLETRGLTVLTPDRVRNAPSWQAELEALSSYLDQRLVCSEDAGRQGLVVVGASNGCTPAALLALTRPELVRALVLAWPATGGDAVVDQRTRAGLLERGAEPEIADALLAGETLRGLSDSRLEQLGGLKSVAVVPSEPENRSHQRKTVDALLRLVPRMRELAGTPEPPLPDFAESRDVLVGELAAFAADVGRDCPVELRRFPEEAEAVVATWATSAVEVGLLSGRSEYPFPPELVGGWRDRSDDIRAFGFFDGDELIGYGEVWLDAAEDEVELARIILAPEVRGKGMGTELVKALLVPALGAGYAAVLLRVRPENAVAIRTYERAGFRRVAAEQEAEWNAAQPMAYRWMEYQAS